MLSVYLLLVICVKSPTFGPKVINVQTMVFKNADRCVRNAEANKKRLSKYYDQVSAQCVERKVEE